MRITYGGTRLTGEGAEGVADLAFNGSPVVQVEEFARAADITIFDRLRKQNRITFTITRNHANLGAAEHFVMTHADSLANKATLTVIVQDNAGNPTARLTFAQASLSAAVQHTGVTTITAYDVLCGKGVQS